MNFLDRKEELGRLTRLSSANSGGFVAVWGRRRIGKSELMKEWCKRCTGLYTVADRTCAAVQIKNLARMLALRFQGFDAVCYPDWKTLLEALSFRAGGENWHGPLVLDEFPYMAEADSSLVSVLQNWLDGEKSRGGILLALAGSSQHMMQGILLDHDSPIYGRADECFRLEPLKPEFIMEGLGIDNPLDAVMAYAIWGGVPRYWVAAENYGSNLEKALDDLVLNPLGLFHDEPQALLQSEIPSAMSLKPYLDVIGAGAGRVSEIAGRLGVSATALTKPLSRLVNLGLVKREVPFGESEKGGKRSIYKIADPYCRLWFEVLSGRLSLFDSAPKKVRLSLWRSQAQRIFASQWEELSRNHVAVSKSLASLAGKNDFWLPASRWWHGGEPEIDVLSSNTSGTKMLLGEAKWSNKPFTPGEARSLATSLRRRLLPQGFCGDIVPVLFLASTVSNMPSSIDGVKIVTAKEVVLGK